MKWVESLRAQHVNSELHPSASNAGQQLPGSDANTHSSVQALKCSTARIICTKHLYQKDQYTIFVSNNIHGQGQMYMMEME